MKAFEFINKLKTEKVQSIINYFLLVIISLYFFSAMIFDRPGFTFIPNCLLIISFVFTIFRIVLFKEIKALKYTIPIFIVLVLTIISNLFSLTFSYNFLLLFLIFIAAFSLAVSFKHSFKWEIILSSLVIGLSLGMFVILIYYRKTLFSSTPLGFDQFFLNMDGLGSFLSILCCLSCVLIYMFISRGKTKLAVVMIITCFISFISTIMTYRVGSIISIFLFLLTYLFLFLYRKKRDLAFILLISIIVLGLLILLVPFKNKILERIRLSFYQIFYLDLRLDISTRERILLLLSHSIISLMCPFIGFGYNNYYEIYNVGSHSAIGSVAVNYGLISLVIIMYVIIRILIKLKHSRADKHIFICYFLVLTFFSFFYGTSFESRTYYFIFGIALAYSLFEIKEKRNKKLTYFEVSI